MKTEQIEARQIDVDTLARRLSEKVAGEVMFDNGSRALYAADSSNYRQVPIGVVFPRSTEDIVAAVAICREFDAPVLMRGAGTSLSGQTCNVAVVLDVSRHLNKVISIDAAQQTALVEPGAVCDTLRAAAERHGLTFGPDPATHSRCTIGGMVGNNSCGAHSVMAGKTVENIEALEILTYDGERMWVGATSDAELEQLINASGRRAEIYARLKKLRDDYAARVRSEFPKIRRRVSGYNLDELLAENGFNVARALVGTEGTCVVVLKIKTKLVHSPPVRVLVVLGYDDIYVAGDRAPFVMQHGPIALEGLDTSIVEDLGKKGLLQENISMLPAGRGWLMVEIGASTQEQALARAEALIESEMAAGLLRGQHVYTGAEQHKLWAVREVGAGAGNSVPGEPDEPYAGWEDAAVDPARVGDYLRDFTTLLAKYGYRSSLYGHFGDGCIHGRITFQMRTRSGLDAMRSFIQEAADLVVQYGGSISGEHGDGQARAEFLPRMYGPEIMQAFRQFKRIWDPRNRMNPGKVIDAYKVDENLKYDPDYRPLKFVTKFSFAQDFGSFAHAAERCIGVAKCRNTSGGVMCPSFRVTGDEKHSTRGRARLLGEMFRGEVLQGGTRDEAVKDALDLCFSCKSCKSECPAQVDMATYKAEFLAHYYEKRARPRHALAMGLIHRWARLASHAPALFNFFNGTPVLKTIAKTVAGFALQRSIPRFAPQTFRAWFNARSYPRPGARRVILWPDTFNNHFHPETAIAATRVLEAYGCEVVLPATPLCCGRALYDFGMVDQARKQLATILTALKSEIEAGTPIVGLEPACVSVFKDELPGLFAADPEARKLSAQVVYFSDFLKGMTPPDAAPHNLRARVHGHCHHKAVIGMAGEMQLLKNLGVQATTIDSGCCGMAGSVGFRPETYELSVKAAELDLLPAIRQASTEEMIITSGYSCREQVDQLSTRRGMHVAEAAALALGLNTREFAT